MLSPEIPKKITGLFQNLTHFNDIIFSSQLKKKNIEMKKELEFIIKSLCKKHKIKIELKRFKSPVGRAWISDRIIKIPEINNVIDFMVALHEIGHIMNGYNEPKCVDEFKAELYAVKKAKELGIDGSSYYQMSAAYVLRNIAECHNNGNIDVELLPSEMKCYVRDFESDFNSWRGFQVDVYDSKKRVIVKKSKVINYAA